ncbi:MAG: hypothetical protein II105_03610, partial [Ruminococcus sp.]|nr:hypothetical protein [Ruminococcus sp.]
RNRIDEKGKIAQEALDFDVLHYTEIAAEQKKLRAEKEQEQMDKLKKRLHLYKFLNRESDDEEDADNKSEDTESENTEK